MSESVRDLSPRRVPRHDLLTYRISERADKLLSGIAVELDYALDGLERVSVKKERLGITDSQAVTMPADLEEDSLPMDVNKGRTPRRGRKQEVKRLIKARNGIENNGFALEVRNRSPNCECRLFYDLW